MTQKNPLIQTLQELETEALDAIRAALDGEALEVLRVSYLGRKGRVSGILRGLGDLSADERPPVGAEANRVKEVLQEALEAREPDVSASREASGAPGEDLTLPARHRWSGGVHPVNQVIDEIWTIFQSMGFVRARGPEADTEWYNFLALNTPLDHPAVD